MSRRGHPEFGPGSPEYAAQPGDVAPGDLRPEEDAVGHPGGAPGGGLALRAHLERRMRRLVGREAHARRAHASVGAAGGDGLTRPEALHQAERLLQLGHPVLPTEADRLELLLAVADGHADVEPAVADMIEGCDVLGDLHGVKDGKQ